MEDREFSEEELDNLLVGNSQLTNEEVFDKVLMDNKDMFREKQQAALQAMKEALQVMKEELQATNQEKEGRHR